MPVNGCSKCGSYFGAPRPGTGMMADPSRKWWQFWRCVPCDGCDGTGYAKPGPRPEPPPAPPPVLIAKRISAEITAEINAAVEREMRKRGVR